jgi:hypothetical protein
VGDGEYLIELVDDSEDEVVVLFGLRALIVALETLNIAGVESLKHLSDTALSLLVLRVLLNGIEQSLEELLHIMLLKCFIAMPLETPCEIPGLPIRQPILLHCGKQFLELKWNTIILLAMLLLVILPLEQLRPKLWNHEQTLQCTVHVTGCTLVCQSNKMSHLSPTLALRLLLPLLARLIHYLLWLFLIHLLRLLTLHLIC